MNQNIYFIVGVIVGAVIGYFLFRRPKGMKNANRKLAEMKSENKDKIMELFQTRQNVTNDDVETMLGVSHATATNYLEELEKEGKIVQHEEVGRGVYYTQLNN